MLALILARALQGLGGGSRLPLAGPFASFRAISQSFLFDSSWAAASRLANGWLGQLLLLCSGVIAGPTVEKEERRSVSRARFPGMGVQQVPRGSRQPVQPRNDNHVTRLEHS
jgi:hypothetical protein